MMSVIFMGICSLALMLFPREIFSTFTASKEILALGIPILHIAAYYLMFDGLQVSLSGVLKGLKLTKIASVTLIAGYWLFGLPFGFLLAYHYKMSLNGFWIGLAVSFLAMSILFLIVIFKKFKELKKVFIDIFYIGVEDFLKICNLNKRIFPIFCIFADGKIVWKKCGFISFSEISNEYTKKLVLFS